MSENINEQPVEPVEPVEQPDTQKKVHEPWAMKLNLTKKDLDTKYFFKRIKAMEGVVKYDLSSWAHFPSDLNQAKELAKKITKDFSLNKKYSGYVVNVYFHLDKKTLRFEIKKYQTLEIKNIILDDMISVDQLEKYFDENVGNELGIYIYQVNNLVFPDLNGCKEVGKNIYTKLESKVQDRAYVVFFNPKSKSVKITIRNKIVKPTKVVTE